MQLRRLLERTWLVVAVGGGAGAALRYSLDALWHGNGGIATLLTNLLGSFALGWILTGLLPHQRQRPWLGPLLGPGFLGGFTTMSGFALSVNQIAMASNVAVTALYFFLSVFGGLVAAWSGLEVGRRWGAGVVFARQERSGEDPS